MSKDILAQLALEPFRPLPFLKGGQLQTVLSVYWPQRPDIKPEYAHRVKLSDGDEVLLMENRPAAWTEEQRIVLLVHGLTGCYGSRYMIRLCRRLYSAGYLVLRMNLRGCGPGFGLARQPYHSGRSDDTRDVLKWLKRKYPAAPVTQIGFSLGGNLTLKMAGEDKDRPSGNLDSIVAVSPPIHLAACARKVQRRDNWLLNYYFVSRLRRDVARLKVKFPDMIAPKFPKKMSLRDFDEFFTAPICGFKDAEDYYRQSSSMALIPDIRVAGLILCALDDPVVDTDCFGELDVPPNLDLILTRHGGHVGFLGWGAGLGSIRWMDDVITNWVMGRLQ